MACPDGPTLTVPLYSEIFEIVFKQYFKLSYLNAKYITAFYRRR
jgi:hypothetical protein